MGWMQRESEREKRAGTKGSFSRLAASHGRTTHEEAEIDKNKTGTKVQKKALMALHFEKARKKG